MKAPRRAATLAIVATAIVAGGAVAQSPAATQDLGSATGDVTALMIGWPDSDGIDATTGKPTVGIQHLKELFEAKHPEINLNIINIPWGEGSTGYGPKTESMVQANEACVYHMPGQYDYAKQGVLQDLDVLIAQDKTFEDVWEGNLLENSKAWTPDNPHATTFLPAYTGVRVIHWDSKLFDDWGVEPLSAQPTVEEIATKAAAMTGINPRPVSRTTATGIRANT
jgi:multiple sugar transport system substrate-binding protein